MKWESTGEVRPLKIGEWCLTDGYGVQQAICEGDCCVSSVIMRPVREIVRWEVVIPVDNEREVKMVVLDYAYWSQLRVPSGSGPRRSHSVEIRPRYAETDSPNKQ